MYCRLPFVVGRDAHEPSACGKSLGIGTRDVRRKLKAVMVFGNDKGRELEYIDIDPDTLPSSLELMTPIVLCSVCARFFAEDETRNGRGQKRSEKSLAADPPRAPKCWGCVLDGLSKDYQADMLDMLEEKLGLTQKHRDALKEFIETVLTDPKKIVQVADLDNRVRSLERQIVIMWGVIGGLVVALLAVVVALIVALVVGS